jgi:hypothetical protein
MSHATVRTDGKKAKERGLENSTGRQAEPEQRRSRNEGACRLHVGSLSLDRKEIHQLMKTSRGCFLLSRSALIRRHDRDQKRTVVIGGNMGKREKVRRRKEERYYPRTKKLAGSAS